MKGPFGRVKDGGPGSVEGVFSVTVSLAPSQANVKDNGFPWPPPVPGLLGILRKTQLLRYYSVREAN